MVLPKLLGCVFTGDSGEDCGVRSIIMDNSGSSNDEEKGGFLTLLPAGMLVLKLGEVVNIVIDDYVEVIFRFVSGDIIFGEGLRHGGGVLKDVVCYVGEDGGEETKRDETRCGRDVRGSEKEGEQGVQMYFKRG